MKKKEIYGPLILIGCGAAGLLVIIFWKREAVNTFFYSWAISLITTGLIFLGRYFYWSRPDKAPLYEKKLEKEKIKVQDERFRMLQDKSGRAMYLLSLLVLTILLTVFTLLKAPNWVNLTLGIFWFFMFFGGFIVFKILDKRL